jgi:hypothetical protein
LWGYRAAPNGYVPLPPDEHGRLWLEPFRMWMGVGDDDQVVCFEEKGERILDGAEVLQEWEAAKAEVAASKKQTAAAKKRADEEARARQEAEARVQALEAELRRLRGGRQ